MFNFSGTRPNNLGVTDGALTPCPGTPNCVCSQSDRPQEKIDPLPAVAMDKLQQVITAMDGATIIEQTDNYLYAEFKTKLMGFVDDVEFFHGGSAIQVRSASRLGKSDLGLNRKRVEEIRSALA
ncbi:MAG: DUF1499 domain-containing protein [Limnothrix sp. RL_2_0]|nr:DUF1499 domain-containing protein [Limnothrix sp. RL_2_0]